MRLSRTALGQRERITRHFGNNSNGNSVVVPKRCEVALVCMYFPIRARKPAFLPLGRQPRAGPGRSILRDAHLSSAIGG